MLKKIGDLAKEFLKISKDKSTRIISNKDCEGITSAAILIKTLKRLDQKFSLKIIQRLDKSIIQKELKRNSKEIIFITCSVDKILGSLKNINEPIFILDNGKITKEKLNEKIKIINPNLFESPEENFCTRSELSYLFSKEISIKNKDLSKLGVIGMISGKQKEKFFKINKQIIDDTEDLTIKKGVILHPSTRPLRRSLEYSTSPYIPGVTGNGNGVREILKEAKISEDKTLLELDKNEMSRLITSIILRQTKDNRQENVLGNLYTLKFFNVKEDIREISVLINACANLGHADMAVAYCLENEKAKSLAIEIYTKYNQELISGLKIAEKVEKINGNGFVIFNIKDKIKDEIFNTVCSLLISSPSYEEGTILVGMGYNQDKLKVSIRIAGRGKRNLKEILERTILTFRDLNPETTAKVNGHTFEAECLVEKEKETAFIEALKKNLEVEIIKV